MQIDWLTVAAQIVNFLILIWLLQRVLFRPVLRAMTDREREINRRLRSADVAREEAEAETERLHRQQRALNERSEEQLRKARADADDLRERLQGEVRQEVDEKRKAWLRHLDAERDALQQTLQKESARYVFETVRQSLSKFADANLSEQIAAEFVNKLELLGESDRRRMKDAAKRMAGSAIVESGIELPSSSRGRITRAIHAIVGEKCDVDYRTDKALLLGVRVVLHDQNIEWSASRHLDRLERKVNEALDAELARELSEQSH